MFTIENRLYKDEVFALTTDRLRLSVLKKKAAKRVADYYSRNRTFHQRFAQTHQDEYFTEETQRKYLTYDCKEYHEGRIVPLWITYIDQPDRIIGRVSFFNFAYGGMMSCAVGYHLDKEETGKGIMTEALTEGISLLFNVLKMHRIEAFILPENEKSIALIKRVGFIHEGSRISYMHINGKYRDHEAFYILEENFK